MNYARTLDLRAQPSRPSSLARPLGRADGSVGKRGADEAPRPVGDAGDDDCRAAIPLQGESPVNLLHVASQPATADVGGADSELAQPAGEPLLVPGRRLKHGQRSGERRPQWLI